MGRDRQGAGGLELLCITPPTCCFHTVALIGAVIAKTAASQKPCERVNLACHAVHSTCQQLHAARWVGTFNTVLAQPDRAGHLTRASHTPTQCPQPA